MTPARTGAAVETESRRPEVWARDAAAWRPYATWALLATMGAVWILQVLIYSYDRPRIIPGLTGRAPFPGIFWDGRLLEWHDFAFVIGTDWPLRPWTLVTSTFAHSPTNVYHILFNGLFLLFFGPAVERLLGRGRFVVLFLLGGAISGIVQVHATALEGGFGFWGQGPGALGASGALMVLLGVLILLLPRELVHVYGIIPVPLWLAGIGYAALDVVGAFTPGSPVGNFAHLSGLALGLGYGWWTKAEMRRRGLRIVKA
jgi:membrane associated rhomboid family serine protease